MQDIPCTSALLAQETLFLTQKALFLPKDLQKVRKIATNPNLRQNSVYSSFKFWSDSKLFSGGPPCPRTTSATLFVTHLLISEYMKRDRALTVVATSVDFER